MNRLMAFWIVEVFLPLMEISSMSLDMSIPTAILLLSFRGMVISFPPRKDKKDRPSYLYSVTRTLYLFGASCHFCHFARISILPHGVAAKQRAQDETEIHRATP